MGSHFGVGEFTTHFRLYSSGDWLMFTADWFGSGCGGQNPDRAPSEHPIQSPSKIGSKMGGEFAYPKMVPYEEGLKVMQYGYVALVVKTVLGSHLGVFGEFSTHFRAHSSGD